MGTITFSITSAAKPSITVNRLKYAIYKHSDLSTIYTSQSFAPAHPQRTVQFPGLPRDNYRFRLLEVLPDDVTIVKEILYTDFVPGNDSPVYFEPVEIKADVTPGVMNATTSFVFDGTETFLGSGIFKPDWIGREIFVERVGQGTMQKGVQYSWDGVTGTFNLLQTDDTFQANELFNVEFALQTGNVAGVQPQALFTGVLIITGTTALVAGDIGKKIIIKGATAAFDVTLPTLVGSPENIPTYVESGVGNHKCVRFLTQSGEVIDWMKGSRDNLKIGVCESFVFYKNIDAAVAKWRIHDAEGNFLKVGQFFSTYGEEGDQFNALECDGRSIKVSENRRLYEDFVLVLDPALVSSYAAHGTGNNKYKFSYASGDDFFLPDLRDLYERNAGTSNPTDFLRMMLESHKHQIGYEDNVNGGVGGYGQNIGQPNIGFGLGAFAGSGNRGVTDNPMRQVDSQHLSATRADGTPVAGSETRPNSNVVRRFVLT